MTEKEKISILYHSVFNYSLTSHELHRWLAGKKLVLSNNGFTKIVQKRSTNTNVRKQSTKFELAKKASEEIAKSKNVLFVGITGSLAMNNAKKESDIDLMIITKVNKLWSTRAFVLFTLLLKRYKLRRSGILNERDKLCINVWIDESKLSWEYSKNAYIAHEIAQVVPLINKEQIYERWILQNKWVSDYWPNALPKVKLISSVPKNHDFNFLEDIVEFTFYKLQFLYMYSKITREITTAHIALFHPYDWGEKVMKTLKQAGVVEV